MKFHAILLDLDGTLVDTIGLYERAVTASLREIGADMTKEQYATWYMGGFHLKDILAKYGLSEDLVPQIRPRRDEIYIELLRTETEWLPGAEDMLRALQKKKMPLGIVTGSWITYVNAIDEKLYLKKIFGTIVTADDMGMGTLMKPHPHGLLVAADALGVDPSKCLYIGDQMFDVEAAHAAGMPCWVVDGRFTPDRAKKSADRFMESIDELSAML